MKKYYTFMLIFAIVFTGCTNQNGNQINPLSEWLNNANLDAHKSPDELYAAALNEGVLLVYSTSTRMMDVAASFEKQYPGLIVKVEHLREPELYETLMKNYASGNFAGDVICSADGRGIMTVEFLEKLIAVKYVPHGFADKILPENN